MRRLIVELKKISELTGLFVDNYNYMIERQLFARFIKHETLFHLLKCENCCYFLFHKNYEINIFNIWSDRWKNNKQFKDVTWDSGKL